MSKRVLALIMAAVLLVGIMAGCSKDQDPAAESGVPGLPGTNTEKPANVPQSKYAYKASYLPVSEQLEEKCNYINYFCVSGDSIVFAANCVVAMEPELDYNGEPVIDAATGEPYMMGVTEMRLFRLDLSTQQVTRLEGYHPTEKPEGMEGDSYVTGMFAGTDDTIWMCEEANYYYYDLPEDFDPATQNQWDYYTNGGSYCWLNQYDGNGNLLTQMELKGDEENESIYNILMDANGYIYGSSNMSQKIYIFDQTGKKLGSVEDEQWGDLTKINENQIGCVIYTEEGKRVFKTIDPKTLAYGEEFELCYNAYDIYPGNEAYKYFYNQNGVIYGYDEAKQESERMFSWLDCDVDSNNLNRLAFLPDGRVMSFSNNWRNDENHIELVLLEQVDASTLPQKEELVFACMYLDWNMRTDIINFNKSHDDVRIVVNDYSQYATEEDYNAGLQKLNTEILSGMAPDIFWTDSLPMEQYAARGILVDLWPLIENDPAIGREAVMEHFFDVLSIDGKLYQLYTNFAISSVVGSKAVVGDKTSWTVADLLEAKANLPEGATIFGQYDTRDSILNTCISRNLDTYIDWSTGQCSFDSQDFKDILTFSATFPVEINWDELNDEEYESEYSRLKTGKQLLMQAYLGKFHDYQYNKALMDGEPVFIGYPSASGNGNCFTSSGGLAISASCKNLDAAWSFVGRYLTEAYQNSEDNAYQWAFPTNRAAFEAQAAEAMKPIEQPDYDAANPEMIERPADGIWIDEDTIIEIQPLTQEDYDDLMAIYEACNTFSTYNEKILDIITEETAAFFDGQKTVDETAAIIQNRVSLYVAEEG